MIVVFDDEGFVNRFACIVIACGILCFSTTGFAMPSWMELQKFHGLDTNGGSGFGNALALDGDRLVVGSSIDDTPSSNSGSAYIFERDARGVWVEVAKLVASDSGRVNFFGGSVAIQGDTVVVGAYGDDDLGGNSGSAYIFERNAQGVWVETKKLLASDGGEGDFFGISVAFNGADVLIGAHRDDDNGTDAGAVYVFGKGMAGQWMFQQKFSATTANGIEWFGAEIAVDGDTAIIGGPNRGGGKAYLFERNVMGQWVEVQQLLGSDTMPFDEFGSDVAIDGDRLLIGAHRHDVMGVDTGAAYIFERNAMGVWVESSKLTAPNGMIGDSFGLTVELHGDRACVGAYRADVLTRDGGAVYLYDRDPTTNMWGAPLLLSPSTVLNNSYYGQGLAMAPDEVLVGASLDSARGQYGGAVYRFAYETPNDGPVAEDAALFVNEDQALNVTLGATDVNQDTLTYTIEVSPEHGVISSFDPMTGALIYTPDEHFNGVDSFRFSASDGTVSSLPALISITILPINDYPVLESASVQTMVNTPISQQIVGVDVDGDELSYRIERMPTNGQVTITDGGVFTYTPMSMFSGDDSFTVVANDSIVDSEAVDVLVQVGDAMRAQTVSISLEEDAPITKTINETFGGMTSWTYLVVEMPKQGTISLDAAAGSWTYTPTANYNGEDVFIVRAEGVDSSIVTTVRLTINPVDDAPLFVAPTPEDGALLTTSVSTEWVITLAATDVDGDPLTYRVDGAPGGSVFDAQTGVLRWTPQAANIGEYSLTLIAISNNTETQRPITLTVNDEPTDGAEGAMDEGCGCRSVDSPSSDTPLLLLLMCVLGGLVRRHRLV